MKAGSGNPGYQSSNEQATAPKQDASPKEDALPSGGDGGDDLPF
jgi:hypothetical protein